MFKKMFGRIGNFFKKLGKGFAKMFAKKYVPASKLSKVNSLQNLLSITFWLVLFTGLAILADFLVANVFGSSYLATLLVGNTQFIYSAWAVQATVTVLAFFISNIMTSIVKDIFYGLSIKDILMARINFFEVSFWHQSIMCILLVLLNIPFVLLGLAPAVLVVTAANLFFIIYMLNNAFSYVFNSRVIVNRVDKIVKKEINTGKTILDLKQLILSLENETKRRITNNELKRTEYNITFLLHIYQNLKMSDKTSYIPQVLKSLKNNLIDLIRTNNFETLDTLLTNYISSEITESEYSSIISELIESVSLRFVNYTTLDIEEYNIHEHLSEWSKIKGDNNFVNSVASSFYNYYTSILLNSKVPAPTKNKLLSILFNTLIHPQQDNLTEQSAFKIALMHIVREMIITNSSREFKDLLNTVNQSNIEDKPYIQEVVMLLNAYVYYLASNKNINNVITRTAREFLHSEPNSMELNSSPLADLLKNSNAKYIKHFWDSIKTLADFNTSSKLSVSNYEVFNEKLLTKFYLIYWKLFANSLENINLNENEENQKYYNMTLINLIKNVKEDEDHDYKSFKDFCELYQIDYKQLKADENWTKNADKIDDYLRDSYIDYLTNSAMNNKSKLNVIGTTKQQEQLLEMFKKISNELPLHSDVLSPMLTQKFTLPFVIKADKLNKVTLSEETLNDYSTQFRQMAISQINDRLAELNIEPKIYSKTEENLKTLLQSMDGLKVNAMTHNLSNNIDVLNNEKDEPFINELIEKEKTYQLLSELEINEYLFINTTQTFVNIEPVEITLRSLTKEEVEILVNNFKITTLKNKDEYRIEEYYGTLEQAHEYYSSLYVELDVKVTLTDNAYKENILRVEIK
ncbi:MAG: hypothetical protein AB7S44_02315 [Spirochaetales bacterium]